MRRGGTPDADVCLRLHHEQRRALDAIAAHLGRDVPQEETSA
jgi:hypothetical protein